MHARMCVCVCVLGEGCGRGHYHPSMSLKDLVPGKTPEEVDGLPFGNLDRETLILQLSISCYVWTENVLSVSSVFVKAFNTEENTEGCSFPYC